MASLFINILTIFLLVKVFIYLFKKKTDSMLIWYILLSIFFINFPLLIDSFIGLTNYSPQWEALLAGRNYSWAPVLRMHQLDISIYILIFNLALILTYFFILPIKRQRKMVLNNIRNEDFLPWIWYILMGFTGLFVFMYIYNITEITSINFLLANRAERYSGVLVVLYNFLIFSSMSSIFKTLATKNYLIGVFTLIPTILISYITLSRTFMIAVPLCVLYYYISKMTKINMSFYVKMIIVSVCVVGALTVFRGDGSYSFYPVSRDASFIDMFYSFEMKKEITTEGTNTLKMISSGLPFVDMDAEDITIKLANYKYRDGWGSLHPSIYGWSYIDLGWYGFTVAIFFGFLFALSDFVRQRLPLILNLFFISFMMRFLSVMVRGSVQNAYTNYIYILFIFIVIYIFKKYFTTRNNHSYV